MTQSQMTLSLFSQRITTAKSHPSSLILAPKSHKRTIILTSPKQNQEMEIWIIYKEQASRLHKISTRLYNIVRILYKYRKSQHNISPKQLSTSHPLFSLNTKIESIQQPKQSTDYQQQR
ncbi:hypothetical protein HanIR_Chr02g0064061 [Helianthus annuus]|nr:hypothetical protein HanIR_Chr02g0064061 [Helianthus annuus]